MLERRQNMAENFRSSFRHTLVEAAFRVSESLSCKARGESCSRPDVKKYGRCLTLDCPIYAQAFTTACNLVAQQMLTNAESPLAA